MDKGVYGCQKPPSNLTTDGQGHVLSDAKEVAKRWYDFLLKKFAATKDEVERRPPMETLTPTQGSEPLTEKEVLRGLAKMKRDMYCGVQL